MKNEYKPGFLVNFLIICGLLIIMIGVWIFLSAYLIIIGCIFITIGTIKVIRKSDKFTKMKGDEK
ncbi:hypothetical protein KAI04_04090 [Candidatus Pacearchaeota archaeon]|nr:hypothetical protein [Candidatus Pacearchaeota archaeon]